MKKLMPLLLEEIAANGGFTHYCVFTADDLTEEATNTAQEIELPVLPKGWIYNKGYANLVVPFEDLSDPAFNSNTFILGDAGDDDRYITSAQINKHGTPITYPKYNSTAFQFTGDTTPIAKFGSMAAKSLKDIDKGELHLFVQLIDTLALSELHGETSIVK